MDFAAVGSGAESVAAKVANPALGLALGWRRWAWLSVVGLVAAIWR